MSTTDIQNIHWLGHASFRIDGKSAVIYVDPWQIGENPKPADLILITHDHSDHCSPEDVAKIQTADTIIVTVKACVPKLSGDIKVVRPGDQLEIQGVSIQVVAAYNLTKFRSPGVPFHPKENQFVGFIVTVDGQKIYHSGDTDVIPEMSEYTADIALLPVSGTYVMTADEALQAAEIIGPKLVIPMHIGRGIGSQADAENFKSKSRIPVTLLPFEN
jgi:L-ascorbate metabolism protein UlaG (beta-lactamase superfamily)